MHIPSDLLSLPLCPPSGLISTNVQMCRQELCVQHRLSVIYGHPVLVLTRSGIFKSNDRTRSELVWCNINVNFHQVLSKVKVL